MGLQDKPSCKKSSLRGGWRQEGALAGLRTGSLGSSGSGPTQWGPGEPHPTASRFREEAEWSSGTASRGDGLSVPLPALLELDGLGMGEFQPRWCWLPPTGSPKNLGTAWFTTHRSGQGRAVSGCKDVLLWTGHH